MTKQDGFYTGAMALILYKTEYMSEALTDMGTLHVEPSGEWWFDHWKDESCDMDDIIEFKQIHST